MWHRSRVLFTPSHALCFSHYTAVHVYQTEAAFPHLTVWWCAACYTQSKTCRRRHSLAYERLIIFIKSQCHYHHYNLSGLSPLNNIVGLILSCHLWLHNFLLQRNVWINLWRKLSSAESSGCLTPECVRASFSSSCRDKQCLIVSIAVPPCP